MDSAKNIDVRPKAPMSSQHGLPARSHRSSSTKSSSVSAAAAKARAKAEAARARVAFAEREISIKVDKARLEANLDALHLEREAAAASAQAEALEAAVEQDEEEFRSKRSLPVMVQDAQERVAEYVDDQTDYLQQHYEPAYFSQMAAHSIEPQRNVPKPFTYNDKKYYVKDSWHAASQQGNETLPPPHMMPNATQSVQPHTQPHLQMKRETEPNSVNRTPKLALPKYSGTSNTSHSSQNSAESNVMMDMAKYLARKELVSTGLSHFDDCPESYRAWKSSFFNTINDLDLTASEQLDLLSKWLGKESSEHVRRLRAVNISNPKAALQTAWARLDECYGAPEVIESALFSKLDNFPRITNKDMHKLRELGDLLKELLSAKEDGYLPGLAFLDTSRGIKPVVEKLPFNLQERWLSQGSNYKEYHKVSYPPFSYFVNFISYQAKTRNDPSFTHTGNNLASEKAMPKRITPRATIAVHQTKVSTDTANNETASKEDFSKQCPIHRKPHPLKKCRGFRLKTIDERKTYLKEQGLCFKCCSSSHLARDCKVHLKCHECNSEQHIAALHPGPSQWATKTSNPSKDDGGESEMEDTSETQVVSSQCTKVCGDRLKSKSCSKICLVNVYPSNQPEKAETMYAMLDDQSNTSLARSQFFDIFNIEADSHPYTLKTCAGSTTISGRRATGYQIEAVNGGVTLSLPALIECDDLPDNRDEIPTPEAAQHHTHLKCIAKEIPTLNNDAQILLLLGRDILRVHKVRRQIDGPGDTPFAQQLDLGWVLVGDVCLGKVHKPVIHNYKTNILEDGRPSLFTPCMSHVNVKQAISSCSFNRAPHGCSPDNDSFGHTVFARTVDDDKRALSIEDEQFLKIMNDQVFQDESNSWVAPLPFKTPRPPLPNNREQAMTRLSSLRRTLERKPKMKEQFVAFMQKVFDNNHAEPAPPIPKGKECWYLPMFGVYHPRKPERIRVVFDSSAQSNGISLNNVLLTGPDLANNLMGVLIRFRREKVAVMADIEQMFHCFVVREDHRDYLRFLWFRENDLSKDIVEYRMRVHVFGNSPSPAVATYCLRRAAELGEQQYGSDTRHYVEREFYVDDGLVSKPTEEEAITLLQETQDSLSESNLRLHKIMSNSVEVLKAFPEGDHAKDINDLFLGAEIGPAQRSLGLSWEVKTDTFTFQIAVTDKPFTRRGVLSTINSLFDPLGFVAPVTIQGKSLLRELTLEGTEWDAPLSQDKLNLWEAWRDSLQELQHLHIPRAYTTTSPFKAKQRELCIFSDASTKAIGTVAYLRTTEEDGQIHMGFILGKAKLAPPNEPTIPRLELCAAVLAVEVAEFIAQEIDLPLNAVTFYCDSKVVLGYIHNQTKRFYVYVHNRVLRIRQSTEPSQWRYVATEHNPADHASRAVPASILTQTNWFTGPDFLYKPRPVAEQPQPFELVDPDADVDIRPLLTSCVTSQNDKPMDPERFERFSSWKSLQRAIATLLHVACSFQSAHQDSTKCTGWHRCSKPHSVDELSKATKVILLAVQRASFPEEYEFLSKEIDVDKKSSLFKLNPLLGPDGLLRIGGRLKLADLSDLEKHPIILPGKHHVSTLLIRHHHERVEHQGRSFTEGAVRADGIWLIGGKRRICSILHGCVTCRKLRGKREKQRMSDLPQERLSTSPPFTYTGVDVFGPWLVTSRRTRGGLAQSKRWAALFTCLSTRAVHIELLESMDISSFINSLRRFFAIRGPSQQLHSDCGTNFIGACKELEFRKVLKESEVQRYTIGQGCSWHFNPPHSSHMGGAWERMIGVSRRILDSMLMRTHASLSHEVLSTFMAEVTAIINSRPLVSVSSDPDSPQILTPALLLTHKPSVTPPPGKFAEKDLYKQQWRQVQRLADQFWSRWKREYLHTLQVRQKWQQSSPNIEEGDVVMLKDSQTCRNDWPMGLVTRAFPGRDGKVRKIEIKVAKYGSVKKFFRPVTEIVLLLKTKD